MYYFISILFGSIFILDDSQDPKILYTVSGIHTSGWEGQW